MAERFEVLLEVAQAISSSRNSDELFRDLAQRYGQWFVVLNLVTRPLMNWHRLEQAINPHIS